MSQLTTQAMNGSKRVVAVAVGAGAAVLLSAANLHRKALLVRNNTTGSVLYLGSDSTVTAVTGYPLAAGESLPDSASGDAWWAISGSGTVDVRLIEVS